MIGFNFDKEEKQLRIYSETKSTKFNLYPNMVGKAIGWKINTFSKAIEIAVWAYSYTFEFRIFTPWNLV